MIWLVALGFALLGYVVGHVAGFRAAIRAKRRAAFPPLELGRLTEWPTRPHALTPLARRRTPTVRILP